MSAVGLAGWKQARHQAGLEKKAEKGRKTVPTSRSTSQASDLMWASFLSLATITIPGSTHTESV